MSGNPLLWRFSGMTSSRVSLAGKMCFGLVVAAAMSTACSSGLKVAAAGGAGATGTTGGIGTTGGMATTGGIDTAGGMVATGGIGTTGAQPGRPAGVAASRRSACRARGPRRRAALRFLRSLRCSWISPQVLPLALGPRARRSRVARTLGRPRPTTAIRWMPTRSTVL